MKCRERRNFSLVGKGERINGRILKIMVPILLIVFLLMGLWVSVLHFPWEWMTYVAMGLKYL